MADVGHAAVGGSVQRKSARANVAEVLSERRGLISQLAIFAVGATSGLHIMNFTATGLSVVCLLLAPGYLLMTHRGTELFPLVLAVIGWIAYLLSGVVNGVSLLWPNQIAPLAFALYLVGLTVVTGRNIGETATLLAGIAVGSIIFFSTKGIMLSNLGGFLYFWKYGIASAVTILVLYGLILLRTSILLQAMALTALCLFTLACNYRSHGLVCLTAAATMFSYRFLGRRIARGWRFGGIVLAGLAFAYVMPKAARAGLLGSALQSKTLEQDATQLPLLLAGRTEPPMSFTAIMEHPLLGWGSSLRLTPDFYAQAEHVAVRMGFSPNFPFALHWGLPPDDPDAIHSILLGSWVEGGVVAALLPMWLLVACVMIVWNHARFGRWAALAVTVALQGIWDLLFAPWTFNMVPEFVCLALLFGAVHFRRDSASR